MVMALLVEKQGVILTVLQSRWLKWVCSYGLFGLLSLISIAGWAMDANTATAAQLETLHGVGPRTAQMIIQERERGGPYSSLEDLSDRVRGIGEKRLARLREGGLGVGQGASRKHSPHTVATPHIFPDIPALAP
jgi:competence protein ComEA